MKKLGNIFLVASMMLLFASLVGAQVAPGLVTYQGRLTSLSGNPVPDGDYSVQFTIYGDPVATGPIPWQEVHTVTTTGGLFSVTLGTIDALDRAVLLGLPSVSVAYLGIKVGSDPELTPRVRLTSVMYAQEATHALIVSTVNQATGGTITSTLRVEDSLGIGITGFAPTERLEVSGNASVSGKVSILANAGPSAKPMIGERWRDNSIAAWGNINPDGTIAASFGVDSVQHTSTGHYLVYLSRSFSSTDNMVAFAQSRDFINNHFLTAAYPLTPSVVEVGLKFLNTSEFMDGSFSFMATGR